MDSNSDGSDGSDGVLCVCSSNVAHHFVDRQGVVPLGIKGDKLLARQVTILPGQAGAEGNNVEVITDNGETLLFEGVTPQTEVEGSSANIAYTLAKLGQKVRIVTAVDDDSDGRTIRATLRRDGIPAEFFPRQGGTAVTAAVADHAD